MNDNMKLYEWENAERIYYYWLFILIRPYVDGTEKVNNRGDIQKIIGTRFFQHRSSYGDSSLHEF